MDDPRELGVVEFGEDGFINKVIEKPKIPRSNKAMVGLYRIREVDQLLSIIDKQIKSEHQTHGVFLSQ